ncbi:hypothetical protein C1645_824302 [Glomus cerebriforme]|uniref:Uncharacterized protein n=1 Tax=Glomus cerebriforme TaxID=658196 RepID=A0A397T0M2_9GLOM|nr:hypothetical protein C1645_824302 [Glomus cerebriforme]
MSTNNYSQNNLSENADINAYESNFINRLNDSNLQQPTAGPFPCDIYPRRSNVNNIDQHFMSYDSYYYNVPETHYHQPTSNDASLYIPYQQSISNDSMPNDVSCNPPMSNNDALHNNNVIISQHNGQNPSSPNISPSFNSINITINQNISEIFRNGFKIIIKPVTNSDAQDQP